jgi:RNA polymerase sigma-70 factor, ECF subfamily
VKVAFVLAPFFGETDPDGPLVAAAARGDVRAFDALVERHQARLTLFVEARIGVGIDADDVTQDIFLTAWRELPKFRGRSRFKTWLYGIGLNLCVEALRRNGPARRARLGLEESLERLQAWQVGGSTAEWAVALEQRTEARRRLAELPEHERQILELYYYGALNLPEISALLDLNLSTLKYRFYQAHRRLRRLLEAEAAQDAVVLGLTAERTPQRAAS